MIPFALTKSINAFDVQFVRLSAAIISVESSIL